MDALVSIASLNAAGSSDSMALHHINRQQTSANKDDINQPRLQVIVTGWRRLFTFMRPIKTFKQVVSISPSIIVIESKQSISLKKPMLVNLYNRHQQLSRLKVIACRRLDTPSGFQYHLKICFDGLTSVAQDCGLHVLNQFNQSHPDSAASS